MIHETIISAQNAISSEEVKSMIKDLAEFNLGVFVPHFRDGKGNITPLPENIIAHENELRISFVDGTTIKENVNGITVGWFWSNNQTTLRCTCACNYDEKVILTGLEAIKEPDVQNILQKLNKYGLGISIPHFHNPEIMELPFDTIAVEKNLEVTFQKTSNKIFEETIPVAWRWNGEQVSTWMVEYLN